MSLVRRALQRLRWLYRSSTLRLTFVLSVIFALGMSVAVFVALSFSKDALDNRADETLRSFAAAIAEDDSLETNRSIIVQPLDDIDELPRAFGRVAQRGRGTVDLDRRYNQSEKWRILVARDDDGDAVVIGVPLDEADDALELLANVLRTTMLIVLSIALLIGLSVGTLAQRRLVRINETLGRLAAGDLAVRTGIVKGNDDIADLARQVDKSAAEIERLVAQTRNLSANIAHDLRTPLARLRAHVETLPDSESRGAALAEASQLASIFDAIMRVARIEAEHGNERFEQVDLGALIEEMAETFGPVVEDAGKTMRVKTMQAETVFADRQMLVQVVANLVQNALVHGGDTIELFAQRTSFGVADNGPGVPASQFDEIIKPMVRLDAARGTQGSGLGLAMVRAITDRHGAGLELSANTPSGLRVTLNFAKL